jgi:hypothetical protein
MNLVGRLSTAQRCLEPLFVSYPVFSLQAFQHVSAALDVLIRSERAFRGCSTATHCIVDGSRDASWAYCLVSKVYNSRTRPASIADVFQAVTSNTKYAVQGSKPSPPIAHPGEEDARVKCSRSLTVSRFPWGARPTNVYKLRNWTDATPLLVVHGELYSDNGDSDRDYGGSFPTPRVGQHGMH